MTISNQRQVLSIAVAALILTGCNGDDGAQGPAGPAGAVGESGSSGADGQNANSLLDISLVGRAVLNAESPEGAAEIVAYQVSKKWIYAINSSGDTAVVNIIDANAFDGSGLTADNNGVITNTNLTTAITVDLTENSSGDANSIAIDNNNELLAVAMASGTEGINGQVAFYDISGDQPAFIKNVEVGDLPDSLAFSPDGSKVVVANEGQPAGDYSVDPEGSISIINIDGGTVADTATTLNFRAYNDQQTTLKAQGLVFANPTGRTINGNLINTTVAMDLEPEYVAISEDSNTAFVSIQENNALAIVDLTDNSMSLVGLGFKDWSELDLDASDKDSGVNFRKYPGLYGMYQPDTIASYTWQNANFIVSANEGDGREYFFDAADAADCTAKGGLDFDDKDGCLSFIDESRVEDLNLASNFNYLNNDDDDIGRLKVSVVLGDADSDGQYEALYTYGARSFTIWDSNGLVVFDSGDDVGRITASIHGPAFNNDEDVNEGDTRSDAKGAEPEALALGKVGDRTFAFVGLERMSGIMVYDITNPYQVTFENYFINRGTEEGAAITGDLAPEGMKFVPAAESATGEALLIVGNEISGSVAVWQIAEK